MTDSQPIIDSSPAETMHALPPLGEVLIAARNNKNLTQQDVSNALRLSLKQVEALETDNFSVLPQAVITRGFIRNYARLLDIDAEPLLLSYKTRTPQEQVLAIAVQSSLNHALPVQKRRLSPPSRSAKSILYVVLLIVISAPLVWFLMNTPLTTSPQVTGEAASRSIAQMPQASSSAEVTGDSLALPEIALPAAERQAEANDLALSDTAQTSNEAMVLSATTSNVKSSAATLADPQTRDLPQTKPLSGNASEVTTLKSTDNNTIKKLQISSDARSWVRVTDKNGKIIFEKILTQGASESVEGQAPFSVVIGNAKATQLIYQGQLVDLTTTTESNVAHTVLN